MQSEKEVEVEKEFEGYLIRGRVDFLTDSEVFEIKYMRASKNNLPFGAPCNAVAIVHVVAGCSKLQITEKYNTVK